MIYKLTHVDLIYEVLADFAEIRTMESVKGVLVNLVVQKSSFPCGNFRHVLSKLRFILSYLEHITILRLDFHIHKDIECGWAALRDWDVLNVSTFPNLTDFYTSTIDHALLKYFFDRHRKVETLMLGRCGASSTCPLTVLQNSVVKFLTVLPSCIPTVLPGCSVYTVTVGPKQGRHAKAFPLAATVAALQPFRTITCLTLNVSPVELKVLHDIAENCPALKRLYITQLRKVCVIWDSVLSMT